jgi:UDP-glucose 4-epimerase
MGKIELKNKRILVTGGNGYLGRNLVARLRQIQAEVFVMDKSGVEDSHTFIVDITKENEVNQAIQKIQPEIVFHLAASLNRARNFDQFEEINAINHQGTYHLLKALNGIDYENFIFASSSEIYGDNPSPFVENQVPSPASPYSLTKVYAEQLIQTYSKTYNKNYAILRIFNFFGRDMSPQFFIPQMIETLKKNEVFEMTKGEQTRDFLYLDDVVQAMIMSAEQVTNSIFNVCSGKAISLRDLVLETKNKLGSQSEIRFGALAYRDNEVWEMLGDNSKIRKELGFEVKFDLKQGIERLIES